MCLERPVQPIATEGGTWRRKSKLFPVVTPYEVGDIDRVREDLELFGVGEKKSSDAPSKYDAPLHIEYLSRDDGRGRSGSTTTRRSRNR